MKKILTLLLCGVSLFAVAQKIALLEPRAGEGSSISGMEKAMVRGELRKAIVNHTGFEAFTRADIDQLMQEQDFQRTGNVSEEDIHKMGEMSGADYLCISTLNKSVDEFYLEAYLINVETGAISNPASQFGELVNGKLANMLPICQALAQELLGNANPVAKPVITRNTPKQSKPAQNSPAQSTPVQSRPAQNRPAQSSPGNMYSRNPSPALPKGVGELKTFPDGSRGVVFYKSDDGHGLAVSLDEEELKWDVSNKPRDIAELPNDERIAKYLPVALGFQNTEAIISTLGMQMAPAAAWCARHGEDWYLPSAGELWYLFYEANGNSQSRLNKDAIINGPISQAIILAGGRPLTDKNYWSSSENDDDDVWKVSGSGSIGQSEKDDKEMVRAVRVF